MGLQIGGDLVVVVFDGSCSDWIPVRTPHNHLLELLLIVSRELDCTGHPRISVIDRMVLSEPRC